MRNLRFTQSIILLTAIFFSSSIHSNANAQADQQDEIRYVQEAVRVMYEQDRNRSFTVRELLEDGYAMCKRIANSDPLENLAEDLIRSGLGMGGSRPQDDPEMMRVAQRYLCNN
ncbi:hypothetical protein [Crocosphaera sp.]|uniref:hypothetical protein n=1 Tax=Crocosphaera sp. TaxID=2729996 RepID=UPI003F1EB8B2|nr:hypothetical protein [Crocosphaera sp.]